MFITVVLTQGGHVPTQSSSTHSREFNVWEGLDEMLSACHFSRDTLFTFDAGFPDGGAVCNALIEILAPWIPLSDPHRTSRSWWRRTGLTGRASCCTSLRYISTLRPDGRCEEDRRRLQHFFCQHYIHLPYRQDAAPTSTLLLPVTQKPNFTKTAIGRDITSLNMCQNTTYMRLNHTKLNLCMVKVEPFCLLSVQRDRLFPLSEPLVHVASEHLSSHWAAYCERARVVLCRARKYFDRFELKPFIFPTFNCVCPYRHKQD